MQEHNPNASGPHQQQRSTRNGDAAGGRFKAGPTTMIINLGEPRPTNAHMTGQHHHAIGGNNMRTIITNSSSTSTSSTAIDLLAPISTVMSTSGVILATATNTMDTHHPYQTHHSNLQQQQQQQQQHQQESHHQINQQMLNEMSAASAAFSGLDAQHIVHHLNESGTIIATTTMNNNNSNNNSSNHSSNSSSNGSNGGASTVHHLGADIQLFQIPITSGSNGTNQAASSHCQMLNASGETTISAANASSLAPAIGSTIETVNLPPTTVGGAQIVYVTSPDVPSSMAAQHNNNNNDKQHHRHMSDGDGESAGVLGQGGQQSHVHHHDQQRQQQHHGQLDMSTLSMTNEQAESLLNEAVEQKDDSQLNLLSIGDQSSFSSPGSMEIDIDASLNDEEEGGYADASNQSQTQSSAGTQQQSHVPGGGGGVIASATNQNTIGGGGGNGYMPLLPSLTGGGGEAGSLIANVSNTASAASVGGGGGGGANGGNANASSCDQTEIKYCIEELCPVCGDKVSGYHYGLLTCESCKGFFKRTVQNKKVYTCVAERQCHIDKTQRKRCPFCRFQKCLEVGMKLEAVRADRMRGGRNKFGPMYKRDRARKLQIMRQRQLAIQTLRAVEGANPMDPGGYGQSYHMNIKQEIQIPQISSLTSSSPDSSPSPIAIALGQVSASGVTTALTVGTSSSIGSANGGGVGGSGGPSSGGSSSGNAGCSASNSGSLGSGSTTSNGGGGQTGANSNGSSTNSIPSTTTSSAVHNNTATDSKQWFIANSTTASPHSLSPKQQFSFDSGSNPTSTADSGPVAEPLSKKQNWKNSKSLNFPRVSPMIREFVQSVDDREWQQQLFSLLQSQSYNQCEVDVFELMCKVLDQNLFSQVDWARNTVFFKDLKVDDQMKLLQNSWSDMLVLDHLHQRIHNNLADETTLHNGQKFDLLGLGLLGVPQLSDHFNDLQHKLVELKFDVGDYICMKFLLLLNPEFADVRGITNRKTVLEGYENVQAALLDYTLTCYPTVSDKFTKLISIIPEIHAMAARGEEHLYVKHCAGSAPTQTLLMEMLHAKRK